MPKHPAQFKHLEPNTMQATGVNMGVRYRDQLSSDILEHQPTGEFVNGLDGFGAKIVHPATTRGGLVFYARNTWGVPDGQPQGERSLATHFMPDQRYDPLGWLLPDGINIEVPVGQAGYYELGRSGVNASASGAAVDEHRGGFIVERGGTDHIIFLYNIHANRDTAQGSGCCGKVVIELQEGDKVRTVNNTLSVAFPDFDFEEHVVWVRTASDNL